MIKITINQEKKVKSSRVNINMFEKKATQIYNTVVKSQIEFANSRDLNINKKEIQSCNNPI